MVAAHKCMKNRLKVLRADRDWTQADLADRLQVTRQTINAIEKGKYDPSLPLAFKIAVRFGLPLEEIFSPETDSLDLVRTISNQAYVETYNSAPEPFVVQPANPNCVAVSREKEKWCTSGHWIKQGRHASNEAAYQ